MKYQSLMDGEHFVVFILCHTPIIGKNRQLVTNELVEFENNRSMFKNVGKILAILEEFIKYKPIQ